MKIDINSSAKVSPDQVCVNIKIHLQNTDKHDARVLYIVNLPMYVKPCRQTGQINICKYMSEVLDLNIISTISKVTSIIISTMNPPR